MSLPCHIASHDEGKPSWVKSKHYHQQLSFYHIIRPIGVFLFSPFARVLNHIDNYTHSPLSPASLCIFMRFSFTLILIFSLSYSFIAHSFSRSLYLSL